jgi:predicted nucleotidyltransferase
MNPARSLFVQRREELIARLKDQVRSDPRIAALWLQGSLAVGDADSLSDVDAYVAVTDANFDVVYADRVGFAESLGKILAWADAIVPGLQAIHCVVDGPVKLDLCFESVSKAPNVDRPAVKMLIDKGGIESRLKTGWMPPASAAAQRVDTGFRLTRQGCTWPIRLLLRGQWSIFAMVELELVNDNLAMLMAAQIDPRLLFHNRLSYPRLLPPERRMQLDALTGDLLAALARRDLTALRDVHLRINDMIVREGRAAYAALGMAYPGSEEGDAAIRAFYEREWPAAIPV